MTSFSLRPTTRVLHTSDSHLSASLPNRVTAWTNFVRFTEWSRPDLVVHTGDVINNIPDSEEDFEFASFQVRRLTVPWRIVPGNHDIGDIPPDPFHGLTTAERLDRWARHFGEDRWAQVVEGWLLVGINSQLLESPFPELEQAQWDWLDEIVEQHSTLPIALFLHKPPCLFSLDDDLRVNKAIGPAARARLLEMARSGRLKMIGCGHLHEFMTLESFGVLIVAAPGLAMAPDTGPTRGLGARCDGAVEYLFSENGMRFRMLQSSELRASALAPLGEPT